MFTSHSCTETSLCHLRFFPHFPADLGCKMCRTWLCFCATSHLFNKDQINTWLTHAARVILQRFSKRSTLKEGDVHTKRFLNTAVCFSEQITACCQNKKRTQTRFHIAVFTVMTLSSVAYGGARRGVYSNKTCFSLISLISDPWV